LPSADPDFLAFVADRLDRWRRGAYLLCHDWHLADDLVSEALIKLFRHWPKVRVAANPDAYAQKILTRCWLTERRRARWRRERTAAEIPERQQSQDESVTDRLPLARLLRDLPPRQRATLILRYYLDYSVEDTAEILGVAPGTVRGQCARALQQLRYRHEGDRHDAPAV
jgi:RNA polymerase sigma-70 factor (sigma-E family)